MRAAMLPASAATGHSSVSPVDHGRIFAVTRSIQRMPDIVGHALEADVRRMPERDDRRRSRWQWTTAPFLLGRARWIGLLMLLLVGCGGPVAPTVSPIASRPLALPAAATPSPGVGATPQPSPAGVFTPGDILTGLPPVGTLPTGPPSCSPDGGATLAINPVTYPGLAGQAWAAGQIVVGSVMAQGTRWESLRGESAIFTYSLVRVEQRARGTPEEDILVREYGGTLDGCAQRSTLPTLGAGQAALLFLQRSTVVAGARWPVYTVVGGEPGLRRIEPDSHAQAWVVTGGQRLPLQQVLDELWQVLSQPPPSALPTRDVVPLVQAPVAPTPRPTPR
jgi:hypothetical protein